MNERSAGLVDPVLGFARALRDAGIPASPPEVVDALRALPLLPLERRDSVRAALAGTLLKEPVHRQTFDRLFDLFFPLSRATTGHRGGPASADALAEALARGDDDALRALARQRVDEHADIQPEANVTEDSWVFRSLRGLNLDAILQRLQEDVLEGRGMSALERRVIDEDLTERMERFRGMLRDEVFSHLLDDIDAHTLAARARRPPPDEVDFLWATDSDLGRMRAALDPLARRLARQLTQRRRAGRTGRLDLRRTIRRSLSTGGVFVEPRFRRPSTGKPELVLLCDISGSMRAFARFTLELTYALATQFRRVRTFVFVDAVDEVTSMLAGAPDFAAALACVERDAQVVSYDGQSWYGNALEQFWGRAGRDLTPRTTVLVVGDARSNFRSSGAEHLQRIGERVRRVYWLNPEPRSEWNTGDSIIAEYEPLCDDVVEVRNLAQLEAFVGHVL